MTFGKCAPNISVKRTAVPLRGPSAAYLGRYAAKLISCGIERMQKQLVAHLASDDGIFLIDVLQTDQGLWLVPSWFDSEDGALHTPARAIRLDFLPHQRCGVGGVDITVNNPIPRTVLDGPATSDGVQQYVVIEGISPIFGWFKKRVTS